jgi:hypothetical protein
MRTAGRHTSGLAWLPLALWLSVRDKAARALPSVRSRASLTKGFEREARLALLGQGTDCELAQQFLK